jgi:hypothetical protein
VLKRRWVKILLAVLAGLLVLCVWGYFAMIRMPGKSWSGPLDPLTEEERVLEGMLKADVQALVDIGDRSTGNPAGLQRASDWLVAELTRAGYPSVDVQRFDDCCDNLAVEVKGSPEIIVIAGHYDSVHETVGADDNGSGAASTLALARAFAGKKTKRTVRFVEVANEEPPHFQRKTMGSLHYARRCKERGDNVVAMLSLETMGFYTDAPGSQKYPFPFSLIYPSTGNFIAFVTSTSHAGFARELIGSFRRHTHFPSEGAAPPAFIPGIDWSDHWSFWQYGYPAVMVTDTAPFRNPNYHLTSDTPEKLDYARLARVVAGLKRVIEELAER